jgi:hypothetical protein
MAFVARPRPPFAPAGSATARPAARHGLVRGLAALAGILALLAPGGAARAEPEPAAERANLPDIVRTDRRSFAIPFRVPTAKDADAAADRVMLNVSRDLGGTWEPAGEVAPTAGSFTYQAPADGEYWFQLRSVDRKGRTRGGAGADLRVLVDAEAPRLAGRVWKGSDGEIVCRYAAIDDSIRTEAVKVEYRTAETQGWKPIAAQAVLARESPAHLVGEEIWWAGEKVGQLTVRITVSDSAGHQTVRQFSLEATDPHVDQEALARELGAPGLPGGGGFAGEPAPRSETTAAVAPPPPSVAATAGGWPAETAAAWTGEQPRRADAAAPRFPAGTRSVLTSTDPAGGLVDPSLPAAGRTLFAASAAATAAPTASAAPGGPLEYRGKPLQLSRSRRFSWDYELPEDRPTTGRVRVELWSTRDGGVSWQRAAVDDDARSPIEVALPAGGLYGFRLEVVPDVAETTGPRPGDPAESWIGIDEEPPFVELLGARKVADAEAGGLLVRYTSRDQVPAPNSARLLFSPSPDGPWATIATGLANQGEHRWQPDRNTPTRVFLRVEVTDAAGNVGSATTPEPVVLATARVVGRLGGLRSPAP